MNWANVTVRIWLCSVLMLSGSTLTFASNDHGQTLTDQQSDPTDRCHYVHTEQP